ncbi:MAG: hypothetical protein ACQERN_12515 [Thermodesulfobacteriota bacterium]
MNPGFKNVWRIYNGLNHATADLMGMQDEDLDQMDPLELRHPSDREIRRTISPKDIDHIEPLLTDIFKDGRMVYDHPGIDEMRQVRDLDLDRLDAGVKRLVNPHIYHVSLTPRLWQLKRELVEKRGKIR